MIDKNGADILSVLNTENEILKNDNAVLRTVIKAILSLKQIDVDGMRLFKVEDVIAVCREGLSSLSSEVEKNLKNQEED